jgi:hypothetical protein
MEKFPTPEIYGGEERDMGYCFVCGYYEELNFQTKMCITMY